MYDRTSLSATINGTADFLNSYAYNADQQLTMVQQQQQSGGNAVAPKEVDYAYNAIGQFTSVSDYNIIGGPRTDVLTATYSYDNGSKLTGLAYTSDPGQTTIDTLGWGYDAANNVTSFSSIDGTATYGYDPTNQLTSASYTTSPGGHQPGNESYSFDSNGNRTNTGYSTGSDNEMTSDGTFNYQHDADGNTTVRTRISDAYATDYRTVYTWDYRNRLTDVEFYDNNSVLTKHVHFVYGVFDHLLATEVDTTGDGTYDSIQHYVLDVSPEIPSAGVPGTALAQPELAFDGYGNIIQRNLVALNPAGVDEVMAQEMVDQGGAVTWLADNNLGSPVDVVNNSGVSANHIVYAAFGQEIYESNNAAIHWAGFAGGHEDPNTGLVNDYHRWYDPATGRWENADPEGFSADDTNLERYVGNAPTVADDLSGLAPTIQELRDNLNSLLRDLPRKLAAVTNADMTLSNLTNHFDAVRGQLARYSTGLGIDMDATNRQGDVEGKAVFSENPVGAALRLIEGVEYGALTRDAKLTARKIGEATNSLNAAKRALSNLMNQIKQAQSELDAALNEQQQEQLDQSQERQQQQQQQLQLQEDEEDQLLT